MTQDERWKKKFDEVMMFMEEHHRNTSRHRIEELDMLNWVKMPEGRCQGGIDIR